MTDDETESTPKRRTKQRCNDERGAYAEPVVRVQGTSGTNEATIGPRNPEREPVNPWAGRARLEIPAARVEPRAHGATRPQRGTKDRTVLSGPGPTRRPCG